MNWEKKLIEKKLVPEELHSYEGTSAVLIPVLKDADNKDFILMTKRTQKVESHKGQVSFPGGYYEKHDKDILATAFRETEEEIGLQRKDVRIVSPLPSILTYQGGVKVQPWVGTSVLPYSFQLNEHEVEKLLFIPFEFLFNEEIKEMLVDVGNGIKIKSPGFYYDNELIWGASARMLLLLKELIIR